MYFAVLGLPDTGLLHLGQPKWVSPTVVNLRRVGLEHVAILFWFRFVSDRRVPLRIPLQIGAFILGGFVHRRNWSEQEGVGDRVHLLVDAGSDGLAAAFEIELVDVWHEKLDLTPKYAAGRIDFLNGQIGAIEMVSIVGHPVGCGER